MPEPDAQEVARRSTDAMWGGDAASRVLGMRLVSVAPGEAVLAMTVRDDMVNGWEICHGGLIATLADSAFAVACNSRGRVTVASGFDITFLEPGRLGDELVATARERALRGRSGLYDVSVARASDGAVLAEMRGRSRATGEPNPAL
ncbi:phenylacetic acid degradation protein PaaD [Marmoricola endophyticus]|uniref:Phenylacetic acid degradation protein PaaD n=1 Tax=Marmoricola endophyticus TaxID=2040280 RepID=A0A917BM50_9ACTN|nr:hydroxyphenylacetyl-CoA thioesterase PaaI [Marmoricola endophyticus]GGF49109.1 phenylacetic acid degradation protein PaaD [Marmoricola endophyticus]